MRSLALKLLLAFLVVSLVGTGLVAIFARQATQDAFANYVWEQNRDRFVADATAYYQTQHSWEGVLDYFQRLNESRPQNPGQEVRPPPPFFLVNPQGYVLVPSPPYRLGERVPRSELERGVPLQFDGQVIGRVLATGLPPERDPTEERYLSYTNQALFKAALGATVVGIFLGVLLARTLTRPLRELIGATRAVAGGELEQQVPVRSEDELGELAASFNQMSADLARSNALRRQMTADIAHDLRTPLTVLSGYLESLRDGVLAPSPQRFETMYDEARQLQRLVEDLRTLSLADAGELALTRLEVPPRELLERAAAAFRHQAQQQGVELQVRAAPELPELRVDPERMAQVLGNLLSNALRHTPAGGRIALSAETRDGGVLLQVQDNGAGIASEVLPHIFERFYRGERQRPTTEGESGLGLAIARSLVEAHGGRISAHSDGLGRGSRFVIWIPG